MDPIKRLVMLLGSAWLLVAACTESLETEGEGGSSNVDPNCTEAAVHCNGAFLAVCQAGNWVDVDCAANCASQALNLLGCYDGNADGADECVCGGGGSGNGGSGNGGSGNGGSGNGGSGNGGSGNGGSGNGGSGNGGNTGPCGGDCAGNVPSACSCDASDPCGWAGDSYCDSACAALAVPMFDDSADCNPTVCSPESCEQPGGACNCSWSCTDGNVYSSNCSGNSCSCYENGSIAGLTCGYGSPPQCHAAMACCNGFPPPG